MTELSRRGFVLLAAGGGTIAVATRNKDQQRGGAVTQFAGFGFSFGGEFGG